MIEYSHSSDRGHRSQVLLYCPCCGQASDVRQSLCGPVHLLAVRLQMGEHGTLLDCRNCRETFVIQQLTGSRKSLPHEAEKSEYMEREGFGRANDE